MSRVDLEDAEEKKCDKGEGQAKAEEPIPDEALGGKGESAEDSRELKEDEKDARIRELLCTLQYLQAEYENHKKRAAKEMENAARLGNERLVIKLLPVLDDFDACLQSMADEKVLEGLKLIHDNLLRTLKEEGMEEMRALGENFDPFLHEAVSEVDDSERSENEIARVVQKGYLFKSRVIRSSKVEVVKHHADGAKEDETNG